jgi:hypothetical protein
MISGSFEAPEFRGISGFFEPLDASEKWISIDRDCSF